MNANIVIVSSTMMIILVLGIGIGWGVGVTVSPSVSSSSGTTVETSTQVAKSTPQPNGTYSLTLVEIMQNEWNSSAPAQPKFFVLGNHGLESSANISLPAHRLIKLTILSYDTPTPNSSAQDAKVKGTVGGNIYLINGTLATGMSGGNMTNMILPWGANVSSVAVGSLAHTFTVQQLGINIPVAAGSTEIAYLYFDHTGTYTWVCLTPCGLGDDGLSGSMDMPGWMMGSLTVY